MLLTIDIGNTHTVVGIFNGELLVNHWRISSSLVRTEDEIAAILNYLFSSEKINYSDLNGACISSVVPDLTFIYELMCQRYFKVTPLVIDSNVELGMRVKYADPTMVGADRLCNAVAGVKYFGAPLIVVDFGTATTFDCIDKNGDYLGGVIAAGINTTIEALHLHAAKLPRVSLDFPDQLIGRTTDDSIKSGILNGTVFMVEGMLDNLNKELGKNTGVVATGGLARRIAERTAKIENIEPFLSLKGMALIYEKNT